MSLTRGRWHGGNSVAFKTAAIWYTVSSIRKQHKSYYQITPPRPPQPVCPQLNNYKRSSTISSSAFWIGQMMYGWLNRGTTYHGFVTQTLTLISKASRACLVEIMRTTSRRGRARGLLPRSKRRWTTCIPLRMRAEHYRARSEAGRWYAGLMESLSAAVKLVEQSRACHKNARLRPTCGPKSPAIRHKGHPLCCIRKSTPSLCQENAHLSLRECVKHQFVRRKREEQPDR